MTKSDAIEVLGYMKDHAIADGFEEALTMAIEALQVPTDGDLIRREDAVKALGDEPEILHDTDAEWAAHDQWVSDIVAIDELPSADRPTKTVKLTDDIEKELDEESYEIGYTHGQMADRPTDKIKREQAEVGAVADGIVGHETITKKAEKYFADRPTFDKPTTKDTLISREEVCEAIERYERHFNTKLETLKDLVAELPNYFTEYDTFCGVDMAEAIEVMTRYNADRPTRGRKDATEEDYHYCDDCEAVEMCMWYPYDGCQFKVSRPTGEWILVCDGGGECDNLYRCSHCGQEIGCEEYDKPKFCGECGAYMRGGK